MVKTFLENLQAEKVFWKYGGSSREEELEGEGKKE